jgi:N-hydroxyarylamine O-acetyltransferase
MTTFDLDAYLKRIEWSGSVGPDPATLVALHRAHVAAIPFENLAIQMGRPVSLDPAALQEKIVRQRRGGYCFEQNTIFAMALRAFGFEVETCEARVRQRAAGAVLPRTHMVLRLTVDGRRWLADVGFGADGLIEPVAFDADPVRQLGVEYGVAAEGPLAVLQSRAGDVWDDLYAVLPDPVHEIDFEVGNWFTSTHPRSAFVLNLTAQRITGGARHVLRNLAYSIVGEGRQQTRQIGRDELVPLLRETFGLDVPADATFRALDSPIGVSVAS